MSRVLRSYIVSGLLFTAGVAGVGYLTSYLGAKHVNDAIAEKLAVREPDEDRAVHLFEALRSGREGASLNDLEVIARKGYPRASALLAWSYDSRAMTKERDALVMSSLNRMLDPDLLLFLGFVARSFDESARDEAYAKIMDGGRRVSLNAIYASLQTELSEADQDVLRKCYDTLQKRYGEDAKGRQAIRFAYFTDTMSCRTDIGPHDADQVGTRG